MTYCPRCHALTYDECSCVEREDTAADFDENEITEVQLAAIDVAAEYDAARWAMEQAEWEANAPAREAEWEKYKAQCVARRKEAAAEKKLIRRVKRILRERGVKISQGGWDGELLSVKIDGELLLKDVTWG